VLKIGQLFHASNAGKGTITFSIGKKGDGKVRVKREGIEGIKNKSNKK
jgi:hypothetical protein